MRELEFDYARDIREIYGELNSVISELERVKVEVEQNTKLRLWIENLIGGLEK